MSKFTKALEKIQEDRQEGKESSGKETAGLKLPPAEDMNERGSFLDRVTTIRNAVPDNRLVMLRFPDSMIAEQYRMMRTSLKTQFAKDHAKVILISSSIHSEGKSVSSSNLALALAENGDAKVALIDTDLRRGQLVNYFGLGKDRLGLSELLSQDLSPKQVMLRSALKNLYIIPRGKAHRKPSDLMSSNRFQLLIKELRAHFDYIILDAPPIMSVADAGIMSREPDGVVFVIQVGRTPKSVIAHSHVLFKQAGAKMLGYILTNVELQSADYKYYTNYYYGEEPDRKKTLKEKTKVHLKKAGWGLRDFEDRINGWWERKVLKKQTAQKPEVKGTAAHEAEN